MKVLMGVVLFVLALPVLIALGIALGPVALVLLLFLAFGLPILLVAGLGLRHKRDL